MTKRLIFGVEMEGERHYIQIIQYPFTSVAVPYEGKSWHLKSVNPELDIILLQNVADASETLMVTADDIKCSWRES